MTRNGPFVSFCPFLAWFWPFRPAGYGLSGLCLPSLSTLCITWHLRKRCHLCSAIERVCRNCPISSCGARNLARLANHLADVHQLDHIQQRQYLQEAKLQPKVEVVVYESEADNSWKNHYRNPVQAQETVYCELSRSQRNEASFKAKAKRSTTKNKTKCKKQRTRTLVLEATGKLCRHGRIVAGLSHTRRLWSTCFRLIVTWLTECAYVRTRLRIVRVG